MTYRKHTFVVKHFRCISYDVLFCTLTRLVLDMPLVCLTNLIPLCND